MTGAMQQPRFGGCWAVALAHVRLEAAETAIAYTFEVVPSLPLLSNVGTRRHLLCSDPVDKRSIRMDR
jgi:hypothetical protein